MSDRLYLAVAALALLFALAVGCVHQPPAPADPSFDPSSAVIYREDP